jgi:hypothetical protein
MADRDTIAESLMQQGMEMPPDPGIRPRAEQGLREAATTGYMSSPYPPTPADAQRFYDAQRAYTADQILRNSPAYQQGVMMPPDPRMLGYLNMMRRQP